MTLNADIRQAARSLASQRLLIEAVIDASPGEPETDWIEWKSDIDLGAKEWQAEVARQILGFANRDPDQAGRSCEGCAYFVGGAAPGDIRGSRSHDPAKVDAWLTAYLGGVADSPRWSATYVAVRGADVLLVTVEAPRWGDPIWTLRKEYTSPSSRIPIRAGSVFTRKKGRTEQADPSDIRSLTARAGSGPRRLSVNLRIDEGSAVSLDLSDQAIADWVSAERRSLLEPVTHSEDAPLATMWLQERRKPDEFRAEVEEYLDGARDSVRAAARRGAIRHELGFVSLWVDNNTVHNFAKVVVELTIPGDGVAAYFDPEAVGGPKMPSRPERWGTNPLETMRSRLLDPLTILSTSALDRLPRGTIDNSGSARIRFSEVDVRPSHSHGLPSIYVLVGHDHAGSALHATWLATASDVSGLVTGNVDIPVSAEVPRISSLLAAPRTRRRS